MKTTGNLFYYVRVILLGSLLLTVLGAYAATPSTEPPFAQSDAPVALADTNFGMQNTVVQAGRIGSANATSTHADEAQAAQQGETRPSRFRETMKGFFGPNLNVTLRQ